MQDHVEWYAVRRSHTHPREAELPHEAQKAADCGAYCGILSGFSKQLCSIVLNSTWTNIQLSLKREVRDTRTQGYLSSIRSSSLRIPGDRLAITEIDDR